MKSCDLCGVLDSRHNPVVNESLINKRKGYLSISACERCISVKVKQLYGLKPKHTMDRFYSDFYLQQKVFKLIRIQKPN